MIAPRKAARTRSAVSNGTALFLGTVDARTEEGRRYACLVDDLTGERGGFEALTITQREAIRTYAGLALLRDGMHAKLGRGESVDPEALGQLGDRMARQARLMGPVRAPDKLTPREHAARYRAGRTTA